MRKPASDKQGLAVAVGEGDEAVVREAKERRHTEKKQRRQVREEELAVKIKALPDKKYGVILADAEWRFEPSPV
jgi:hypothetical protein